MHCNSWFAQVSLDNSEVFNFLPLTVVQTVFNLDPFCFDIILTFIIIIIYYRQ